MWLTYENLTRKTKNKVQESRPEPNWIPWPWPQQIVAVTAVTQTVLPYLALSKVALILKLLTPSVRCPKICPSFLVESHPCLWMFHIVSHCFTLFHIVSHCFTVPSAAQGKWARQEASLNIFDVRHMTHAWVLCYQPEMSIAHHHPSTMICFTTRNSQESSHWSPGFLKAEQREINQQQQQFCTKRLDTSGIFRNFLNVHVRVRRQLRAGEFGQFAVGTQSMEVRRDLRVSLENCFCLLGWWACP